MYTTYYTNSFLITILIQISYTDSVKKENCVVIIINKKIFGFSLYPIVFEYPFCVFNKIDLVPT